jgi:predicted outer membrane repeat protein
MDKDFKPTQRRGLAMKTTMSSRKVKSLGREVRERCVRLLSFLSIAAIVSALWVANAGGEVKTYHTDSGGGWTCGSASIGMTGTLTDAATYNCAGDELDLVLSFDEDLVIGTWIMTSPYTSATRIQAQNMYLYATFDGAVAEAMYNAYQIGYWANGTFTPLITQNTYLNRWQPGEIVEDLSSLAPGIAPAGSYLALRLRMMGNADGYCGTLHFGNTISPQGYIRFTVDETNDVPTISLIPDQRAHVDNPLRVPFTVSDENPGDLVLTATSSNQAILPNSNIRLGGGGDRRTVTLTPVPGQTGSAVVSIMVSDGTHSATENFMAEWYTPNYIYVDVANTSGVEDGTASNPFNTIQKGIDAALSDEYLVYVADGIYRGDGNKNIVLDGAITGITVRSENGPEHTIIDLEYNGRAFEFPNGSISVLDGITFRNGSNVAIYVSPGDDSPDNPSYSTAITNCRFLDNYASSSGDGAAIGFILGSGDAPVIRNCEFSRNRAGGGGGAIFMYRPVLESSSHFVEIDNCSFSDNSAMQTGGAMVLYNTSFLIKSSFFYNNIGRRSGGALYLGSNVSSPGIEGIIRDSVFIGNRTGRHFGSEEGGGAIHVVFNFQNEDASSNFHVINSSFLRNKTSESGGAVKIQQSYGDGPVSHTLSHCTFSGNEAGNGGGAVYTTDTISLYNSIFWGNRAENGGNQIHLASGDDPKVLTIGYTNLEGGLTGIGKDQGSQFEMVGIGGLMALNPRFVLDEDLRLMPDSPCIDAGNNDLTPVDLVHDGDGNPRVLDGTGDGNAVVDMGAFEFDRTAFPVAAVSPSRFVFTAREGEALPERQTLFIRNRGPSALGSLSWKVKEEIPWLRAEPASGLSAGEPNSIALYADHSGLSRGVYTGDLHITDNTGSNVLGTVQVMIRVIGELRVPSQYGTIQEAVLAANDGDVVAVARGTYTRDDGDGMRRDKNIQFFGKAITVKGVDGPENTIIDCNGIGRAFLFDFGEGPASVVQGFTIMGGNAQTSSSYGTRGGGGILITDGSSPTISDCIFKNNFASAQTGYGGGAILIYQSNADIRNCRFLGNATDGEGAGGGAISVFGGRATVGNCVFSGNSAFVGGGILFDSQYSPYSGLEIKNSQFEDNTAGAGGGGIFLDGDDASVEISGCSFSMNSAGIHGGGLFVRDSRDLRAFNCVFSDNTAAEWGGGIYAVKSGTSIINSTFVSNKRGAGGDGGGIYVSDPLTTTITNSIFWDNGYWDGGSLITPDDISPPTQTSLNISYCSVSDAANWPANPVNRIINDDPLFVDPDGDDFRLDPASPCIDRGKRIQSLFSDIRGSLRPVDIENMPRDGAGNPVPQDSAFDIGAYEFSGDYGGIEGDLPTKAFRDLRIGGSLIVTDFEYQIQWKDKDPFAYDTRISHPGEYRVNLALVSDQGLRIDLGAYTVPVSQHGYTIAYTFGPEHIGTWRIRVELASDPNQFALSAPISIEYKEATRYALSQRIRAPQGADPTVEPDAADEGACYWSVETKRLYAIAPRTTVITWYADQNRESPIPVVAYITYPDQENFSADPATRIHIADAMPVELLPPGSPFDLVEVKYAGNDATTSAGKFAAAQEGWSVLLYRDNQAAHPDGAEKFDVIRTYAWNHEQDLSRPPSLTLNPDFPLESSWDIGKEITDPEHEPGCGSGYVFLPGARYDGYGETKAYDRENREGQIFAVNENDPAADRDDLVVVWYKTSDTSGVCWPSKPVRYEPTWPDDARKIVIASGFGSGPLAPEQYGATSSMLIYSQPDRTQPGYNPNEEHAAFYTPAGAPHPVLFALRTDLNKPGDDTAPYQAGDRSRPYVLLKYRDPTTAGWAFEVFEVVAQAGSYTVQAGQVVPQNSVDTRYFIDETLNLIEWDGALPSTAYYLDAEGKLVNHADSSVSEEAYYIDETGQLIALTGELPPESYSLDPHGVIVESDAYFRFHYEGTAGEEIVPPYPLNQPAFGPCAVSFTSTPTSVLEDKNSRFHAKHGGFAGKAAEDGVLHYFYRLQPGFFYDLDDNGVPDKAVGACVPWLGVVDGETEGAPTGITYAIRWPDSVPTLYVGETLTDAKMQEGETEGLPNVADQCVVQVLFDQSEREGGGPSVKLVDPVREHGTPLFLANPEADLPEKLEPARGVQNRWVFKALPYYLQARLTYDEVAGQLKLKGFYDRGTGEPLLVLNTLTQRDIMEISRPFLADPDALDPMTWSDTVIPQNFRNALYALKSLGDEALEGAPTLKDADLKAVTAGDARGAPSYVTLAFNNDAACPGPVGLSVIRVDCPLYTGEIKVIESDDAFDEKVTLRHNADFGGNSDVRWFQWKFLPADFSGIPKGPGHPGEGWQDYFAVLQAPGTDPEVKGDAGWFHKGALDVTVQGTGEQLLPDRWFSVRYHSDETCDPGNLSEWTEPQLYEGWVKRVMKKINLFDQKVKDFRESEVDTLGGMISLAGRRYEGDVALSADPENLVGLGIIETYHTLLERAKDLTIEKGNDVAEYNKAVLFAANRLTGLYMLLGNEAYADAADPTIGFSTQDGQYGTEASSIFCFQNQADSLLEEELALLRGRSDEGGRPFYNRLVWNFTLGDGEVAYKENYNIRDQNTDGKVDVHDAMIQYPQGHGDAWGHYLTAIKYYYDLLRHENFTWIPESEAILVGQTPVEVDYRDERNFAVAAAAKGRTGAEIVKLTHRLHYVEDPQGQWQGYKDLDPERAWGVSEWASRAGQGSFFDWVVGNAMLPPEDKEHTGIQKIDRTTVVELWEVAGLYAAIQAEADRADVGLNPLGVAKDAVPFDIDPGSIALGQTHFEQIFDRAVHAMNNAIAVFNHANQSTMLLRRQQDTLADFTRNIENTEADFNNRLIEVFGYPYPDDCGPRTYPTGYCQTGSDLYHYMYVEPSDLMGVEAPKVHEFPITLKTIEVDAAGALQEQEKEVLFHVATDSRFGLIKPASWQGRRKAPGEIQLARSELLQARGRFERAVGEYNNLLGHIESQAALIEAQHALNRQEINILNTAMNRQQDLNTAITMSRSTLLLFRTLGQIAVHNANAVAEGIPSVMGFIAGLAAGTIVDALAPLRAAAKNIGSVLSLAMNTAADVQSLAELSFQQAKEMVGAQANIRLTALHGGFAVEQQLLQLENLIRTEAVLRLEIYNLAESMQQSAGRYLAALAAGERLLQDRLRFRKQTAALIQDYRYKDMTFRIFRNDALQKYRAQFDLAARYVYLAAKAYDYETTLLDYNTMAGQRFLTDIVRQRTIGLIEGGLPITGTGLADPMKRMWQNFQVLKPQLGFNNPQQETNRFSLRRELFRIKMDAGSNHNWQQMLEGHRVDDLWDIPEFRRYCRPFAPEGVPQPGIVIPFPTTVTSGLNFFEWPLGGGDSYYSASNFATKARSVGVWFSNYNNVQLAQTPRVYLVPVGEDILRSPSYSLWNTRNWQVVDQKMPVPFPIVQTELENNPNWLPTVDTLYDEMFQIRRHSDFRAYHDSGYVNESEMTFDSRIVGRSVWNTRWVLIIPGRNLLYDPDEGLARFIQGRRIIGSDERMGDGITDIKLFFHTYAYSGN